MPILLLLLFSQLSLLLNGTQPTSLYEGGANGYDRGYHRLWEAAEYPSSSYSDPWILPTQDSPFAYDYVFHEPDPLDQENGRFVHCVRSVDLGPTDTENLYLRRTIFSDDARATVWDDNGFYMDRDVDQNAGGSIYDYLPFYPGESDSMMKFVEEESYAAQTLKHQGIQLWKGWNLVSFNVLDDPYTPDGYYFINEIFGPPWGDDWFDYQSTQGGGPDRVSRYDRDPNVYYFPRQDVEYTWNWLWDMQLAYPVVLDEQRMIELSASDWYPNATMDIVDLELSIGWDDSLDEIIWPDNYAEYWFFLGFHLSRQVEVLPANEAQGPFYALYAGPTSYGNQTLKVVKADDGRVFLPNFDGHGHNYDEIGYLEPGRGYALGFRDPDDITDWPAFSEGTYEEEGIAPQPKSNQSQTNTAATQHFTFKERTHFFYPILIDTFAVEGVTLQTGDEFAAFCGDQCVGAKSFQGEFPLVLPAWADDIITPEEVDGYTSGLEIVLKLYDASENQEITFELPPGTQAAAPDDQTAPTHSGYGAGFFAQRSLIYGIESVNQLPERYALRQNYPNPFNAETQIAIELPQRSQIRMELYNLRGQRLCRIYEGTESAGVFRLTYNGANLASGVYFLRLTCEGLERGGNYTGASKMVLLK